MPAALLPGLLAFYMGLVISILMPVCSNYYTLVQYKMHVVSV